MEKLHKVIGNTLISLFGQLITWTSTFLLTLAYGRFLGDVKFGELYFALTFVTLVALPLDTGYGNQIMRGVAQEPEQALRYFANVFILKLASWPVMYMLALLVSWLLGYSVEERLLIGICGFSMLTTTMAGMFASLHYAFGRTIFPTVGVILEKGLSALVGILLLRSGAGVQAMALVIVGGSLISALWQAFWFFRLVGANFRIDRSFMFALLRANVPFLIYGFLLVGYTNIDTIFLSLMTNSAVVGWYGAGARLFDTFNFLPNIVITTIMYPIFSRLSASSDEDLKRALEKSLNFLFFCSFPFATILLVVTPNIIGFLYHRTEFLHTIPVLRGFAPGIIFSYVSITLSATIMSKKQDGKIPMLAAAALAFNVVCNLLFIPMYQHVGAAVVNSFTEALLCLLAIALLPRHLFPFASLRVAAKTLVASLVMALIVWLLPATFNLFALLAIAGLVYVGVATWLGAIPREDCLAVYQALAQRILKQPALQAVPARESVPVGKAAQDAKRSH